MSEWKHFGRPLMHADHPIGAPRSHRPPRQQRELGHPDTVAAALARAVVDAPAKPVPACPDCEAQTGYRHDPRTHQGGAYCPMCGWRK